MSGILASCCFLVNLLLVSWDGSHPWEVQDLLAQGQLPTLQGLLNAGAEWRDLTITDQLPDPTVTKPGHAQMMTGQPKTVTGVYSNNTWSVIPLGLTLPEQWKIAGAQVGWTVQKRHLREWNGTPGGTAGPFYNVWQIADCTEKVAGTPDEAATAGLICLTQFGTTRFFLFVHSRNPDDTGHDFGAGSPEYRQALRDNDTALARLLAALPANTQLIVTTDHGFGHTSADDCPPTEGHGHAQCPDIWVVSFPPLPLAGNRLMDLAPALRP